MIRAVIFDMGGVMLDLDYERCLKSFHDLGFSDIAEFLDPCHQRGIFKDMENGTADEEEFLAECMRHSRPGTTAEDIFHAFESFLAGINEGTMSCIKFLEGRGIDTYVLSNNNPIAVRYCEPLFGKYGISFSHPFKKVFFSYRMKMLKPSPEIFEAAVAEIGCDPSEMLFIDDSQRNLDAASALGIKTILFTKGIDIESEVRKQLV